MRLNVVTSPKAKLAKAASEDNLLATLSAMTPAELDTWIDNNLTNFVQVRTLLKAIAKQVLATR